MSCHLQITCVILNRRTSFLRLSMIDSQWLSLFITSLLITEVHFYLHHESSLAGPKNNDCFLKGILLSLIGSCWILLINQLLGFSFQIETLVSPRFCFQGLINRYGQIQSAWSKDQISYKPLNRIQSL